MLIEKEQCNIFRVGFDNLHPAGFNFCHEIFFLVNVFSCFGCSNIDFPAFIREFLRYQKKPPKENSIELVVRRLEGKYKKTRIKYKLLNNLLHYKKRLSPINSSILKVLVFLPGRQNSVKLCPLFYVLESIRIRFYLSFGPIKCWCLQYSFSLRLTSFTGRYGKFSGYMNAHRMRCSQPFGVGN